MCYCRINYIRRRVWGKCKFPTVIKARSFLSFVMEKVDMLNYISLDFLSQKQAKCATEI